MNPDAQHKIPDSKNRHIRVFGTAVALVVFELLFWLSLTVLWFSIQKVAPNVQMEHAMWWPILLLVPATVFVFVLGLQRQKKWALRLADEGLWSVVLPKWNPSLLGWKFILWRMAFAAALIGILDIKIGAKLKEVKSEGIDLMVALDVSNSMQAEDLGGSRLTVAKRTIERLVDQLDGDRIGLVVFAGDAYVQCPITTDYQAFKLFMEGVSTGLVPVQGTAVGRAIEVCSDGFDPESPASKLIVVMTDGENHEDDAVKAAENAAANGIEIHAVGMGTTAGAPIPLYDRFGRSRGFKTDGEGNTIVSALDEVTLMAVAEAGKGSYTQSNQGLANLNAIFTAMNSMNQTEISTMAYTEYSHHFHWFFICSIFFLLIESALQTFGLNHKAKPTA